MRVCVCVLVRERDSVAQSVPPADESWRCGHSVEDGNVDDDDDDGSIELLIKH